jgi:methionyl-tRNA formyltransferase
MKKYKIMVFGDLPIATKVAEWVNSNKELELVGCVLSNPQAHNNDPWTDTPMLGEYCTNMNIPLYDIKGLGQFKNKGLDLGLVCRFSKILKEDVINLFSVGLINMHGGLLPEFAGLYSSNFSVLYGAKHGGGTLHWIGTGIDTGDIIKRCEFEIEDTDTGFSVFQKTQIALYENMIKIVIPILHGEKTEFINQTELVENGYTHQYFKLNSINEVKKIQADDTEEMILRKVRACDFPGYEPAYMEVNGEKIYLRMHP